MTIEEIMAAASDEDLFDTVRAVTHLLNSGVPKSTLYLGFPLWEVAAGAALEALNRLDVNRSSI